MDALPKELFPIIGNFLDDESRKIARLVNIQWFNSIKYDEFNFEFTTEERFEQICKRLMNYKCMIGIGFDRSNFEFRQKHFKMLGQLTQLTKLECDKCNWQKDEEIMAISNLTNLEVVDVAGRSLPESVLRQLTNLKIIAVTGDDLKIQRSLTNLEAVKYAPDYRDIVDVVEADYSDFLSNLPKMTRLKVTAPIREETLNNINGHFIKYTNIKRLSLINMYWEEHDWFEWDVPELPNLESLKLYEVSEIASISMANMKLTRLKLMADSIIDCSIFSSFTNLVNLELRGRITSTFALDSLTRLKTLKLKFANATSTAHLTFLSTFNNLELFEIGYNRGRRNWNDALLYFSENNNLTSIRFFGAENSFGYLTKFEKLRSLDCGEIDHRSTQYMTVLTNLTRLNIAHMTPKMFLDLGSLTTLKKLNATIGLNDMNADDRLVIDIGRLPNLEDMVFSSQYGIDVTKIELTGFDKLAHLRKLHVDWPIITESVFAEISHCTALRDLEVRADISDASILSLSTLTNLRALRLTARNNDFTGVHLTCLTRLTCLRSLRVFANETKVVTKQDLIEKMPLLGLCDI